MMQYENPYPASYQRLQQWLRKEKSAVQLAIATEWTDWLSAYQWAQDTTSPSAAPMGQEKASAAIDMIPDSTLAELLERGGISKEQAIANVATLPTDRAVWYIGTALGYEVPIPESMREGIQPASLDIGDTGNTDDTETDDGFDVGLYVNEQWQDSFFKKALGELHGKMAEIRGIEKQAWRKPAQRDKRRGGLVGETQAKPDGRKWVPLRAKAIALSSWSLRQQSRRAIARVIAEHVGGCFPQVNQPAPTSPSLLFDGEFEDAGAGGFLLSAELETMTKNDAFHNESGNAIALAETLEGRRVTWTNETLSPAELGREAAYQHVAQEIQKAIALAVKANQDTTAHKALLARLIVPDGQMAVGEVNINRDRPAQGKFPEIWSRNCWCSRKCECVNGKACNCNKNCKCQRCNPLPLAWSPTREDDGRNFAGCPTENGGYVQDDYTIGAITSKSEFRPIERRIVVSYAPLDSEWQDAETWVYRYNAKGYIVNTTRLDGLQPMESLGEYVREDGLVNW